MTVDRLISVITVHFPRVSCDHNITALLAPFDVHSVCCNANINIRLLWFGWAKPGYIPSHSGPDSQTLGWCSVHSDIAAWIWIWSDWVPCEYHATWNYVGIERSNKCVSCLPYPEGHQLSNRPWGIGRGMWEGREGVRFDLFAMSDLLLTYLYIFSYFDPAALDFPFHPGKRILIVIAHELRLLKVCFMRWKSK